MDDSFGAFFSSHTVHILYCSDCMQRFQSANACRASVKDKVLKELALMRILHHKSIINVRTFSSFSSNSPFLQTAGYCLSASQPLSIIVPKHQPLTVLWLAQAPWKERYNVIKSVFEIVLYLHNKSIALRDFRYQQVCFSHTNITKQLFSHSVCLRRNTTKSSSR